MNYETLFSVCVCVCVCVCVRERERERERERYQSCQYWIQASQVTMLEGLYVHSNLSLALTQLLLLHNALYIYIHTHTLPLSSLSLTQSCNVITV